MPVAASIRTTTGHPWPGAPLDWLVTGDVTGDMDDLRLLDLLGDGQALDPSRPVELLVLLHGGVLFQGAAAPTLQRDAATGVTRIGLDISGALRGAGLAGTVPDGAAVSVTLHALAGTAYSTTQPLLTRLIGQGDTLDNAAAFSGSQAGQVVTGEPARAEALLPTSTLAASVYAATASQVTYRLRLTLPLGIAQAVRISAASPGLPASLTWDGAGTWDGTGGVPAIGHAGFGPDGTIRPAPDVAGLDSGGAAVQFSFGDLAPAAGAGPAVLDVLYTTARPAGGPAIDASATEANSFGAVFGTGAAAAAAVTGPDLRVQTGSLDATGQQSYFAVVGNGSGSPVAYSTFTGQFSGPVSSAALDADPFSDRLLDVAAGDLVTFVMAVQNVAAGAPAWDMVLRDTPPPGFIVPAGGADIHVSNGAGDSLAATGDLFSATDGLHLDPGAPLAGYDAQSGLNVVLVTFTLQATSAIPSPLAALRNTAAVVHAAASSGGANLASGAPGLVGVTEVVTMGPALGITLTGTGAAATPGNQLAVGETATFHATITLPSGQSQALHIGAAVSTGLSLVSETITYATPGTTGLWVGETSGSGFDLGTLRAGSAVTIELDIVARAAAAANGQVQVVVSVADPAAAGGRVSAAQGSSVVAQAPALSLQVDGPAQVQAGQAAAYTVRLSNALGAAPAYGVRLVDVLGAGLALVPGTAQASGSAAGAALGSAPGGGLTVDTARLDPCETLVLTLMAQGAGPAGGVLRSQVQATASSLPGGAVAYRLAPLLASGTAMVTGATAVLLLSGASARVGDIVTLRIAASLPAGDNPAVRVVAHLPAGLSFVPGSVRAAGAGIPAVTADAGGVAMLFGPVTAPAGGGTLPVELQAVVGAVPVGAGLDFSAVVETGYAPSPAATATLLVLDTPPVLAGLPALTATADDAPAVPLAGLTLADPDAGQVLSAQVLLSNPADGAFTNLGGGQYDPASGRYSVDGPAGAVQAALRGLSFVPTAHRLAYGVERATTLTVQVSDGVGGTAAAATAVIAHGANTAPSIGGAIAGQATTTTLAVLPFAKLLLGDPDVGQVATLRVQGAAGLGRLGGALGSYDPASGIYAAQGTVQALQADARALVFSPAAAGDAAFAITLDDGAGGIAQDAATTLHIRPSADTAGLAQHFLQLPGATFLADSGGKRTTLVGERYEGPVEYLRTQLIYDSAAPAVIVANADNAFIKSFSGFCAIQVAGGRNVVDAGPGSNFLVGGTGDDTFFLDGRGGAVTWDTVVGFHPGDMVTMFGFHVGVSGYTWADADGAAGYTGRTIHADLAGTGGITASLTFAGMTAADTDRYAITTGTVGGADYLAVIAVR